MVGPAQWGACIRTVSYPFIDPLAYWNNNIAMGGFTGDITILDALTGSQTAILAGHMGPVFSLTYSSDGTFLVSGGYDRTIKLWDVQTGGVVKTLCGHTEIIQLVSISADNTTIASTSRGQLTHLWNIKAGNYRNIGDIGVNVTFLPTNSQLLFSTINGNTQQWDINGYKIGSPVPGCCAVFSPDGTQFISQREKGITIRNTDSKKTLKKINLDGNPHYFCFSPNGRLIAVAIGYTTYLWDTTGSNPHLIQTFIGHSGDIVSLAFSSPYSLISASKDKSIRFWQIGTSLADPGVSSTASTSLSLASIQVVSLQARNSLAFSIDSAGVVKTWNILTGHCEESYKTQIKEATCADIQLLSGRLIIVWHGVGKNMIHVWDARKGKLRDIATPNVTQDLRVVRDESVVLQLDGNTISAWDIWTGKFVCKASLKEKNGWFDALRLNGSKVLVRLRESSVLSWDFGTPELTPTKFSEIPSGRSHLSFIDARKWSRGSPVRIQDSGTGKVVLQLYGKYAQPSATQWDGRYLIAGYNSGEVLILDFSDPSVM